MDSATNQNTNANPNQRKRNAFSDHHNVNHLQVPLQYFSPAMIRNRQLSSPAHHTNCGWGPSACYHASGTMADQTVFQNHEITNFMEYTLAFIESFIPIGYLFFPSDQILITHYLMRKIKNQELPMNKIMDVDIYKDHPEKIVENHPQLGEGEWYFFSPRNRKYVNGSRPDRKAGDGYWKATGSDKEITDDDGIQIGAKKSLVYYEGHAPNGTKTKWAMQEFVVAGHQRQRLDKSDMKLDDHVLCKIYKRQNRSRGRPQQNNNPVVTNHHQQSNNPTTVDDGENDVQVIYDSTNQDHADPTILPDQEPRSKHPMCMVSNQEPNPRNSLSSCFHWPSNTGLQNSLSYYHPRIEGLQRDLVNHDMRFAQPVAPPVLPPPPYHPFSSEPNYMINVPNESCYSDPFNFNSSAGPSYITQQPLHETQTLDFNRSAGPTYTNQQPLHEVAAAAPPYQIHNGGGDGSEFIELSELGFSEDDINNHDLYNLGFPELDRLINSSDQSKQPKVSKHENQRK